MFVEILIVTLLLAALVLTSKESYGNKKKSKKTKNVKTTKTTNVAISTRPMPVPIHRQITEPLLDMPNTEPQPLPLNFAKGPCAQFAREPENDEEIALLELLTAKLKEFVTHLETRYPDNPMTQRAIESWNGEIKMSTRSTGATFTRNTGCMVVNPYYEGNKKRQGLPGMSVDPIERLLTRILHELAHSWSGPHNAAFYDAQRWFLRIATNDLGWPLHVTCRVCCSYPGAVCSKETVCPGCTWLETGCAVNGRSCGAI